MSQQEHEAIVQWLSRPEHWPQAPAGVEVKQTHISVVFLGDELVYKLKKPVKFDFLDFSSVEARHAACQAEVRLNRRMAPDVYLGVASITRGQHGSYQFDGPGEPVEWLVTMRRLPLERSLDRLLRSGQLTSAELERLALWLAEYYHRLPPLSVDATGYCDVLARHIAGNRAALLEARRPLPSATVKRVHAAQLRLVHLQTELLHERAEAGRIVDGHGDLRPEHVVLETPPLAFDCIEFNAEYRQVDVLDELGFLAMECDALAAPHVGQRVLQAYQQASGDAPPAPLLSFYKSYRACVRAKVAALREEQLPPASAEARAPRAAERYLQLADAYLADQQRPLLLVVGGLSGTGKSTLARALAASLGCDLLSTDVVRRARFGASGRDAGYGEDAYTPKNRAEVYEEIFRQAAGLLEERIPAVLDGTFLSAAQCGEAVDLARRYGADCCLVRCECPAEVALQRIESRRQRGGDASEARPELFEKQKAELEDLPGTFPLIRVDSQLRLKLQVAAVFDYLRAAPSS